MFPLIKTIKDVLPHIKGSEEFLVVDRGPYTVINYVVVKEDTFPSNGDLSSDIRRECRGILFDKDGRILSRPLHKFFNLNEKPETQEKDIPWELDYYIQSKEDGSMNRPLIIGDRFAWATRMGITDVAMNALDYSKDHPQYEEYCRSIYPHYTPIFEWCSRKNQIVLDYPEDILYLIAIRNTETGEYTSLKDMRDVSSKWNIPLPKVLSNKDYDSLSSKENIEGVVLKFSNGFMVKVKTEWYVIRSKARDFLSYEKDILSMIFKSEIDDILGFLPENDANRVRRFRDAVISNFEEYAFGVFEKFMDARRSANFDRKRFALEFSKGFSPIELSVCFSLWDRLDATDSDVLFKLLGSVVSWVKTTPRIEKVRYMWKGLRWRDF